MKLLQSINTEVKQLDEVEFINRGLAKVAGKIPGMKGTAANLGAKADAERKIKDLNIEFNKWAGSQGKSAKQVTAKDLQTFLASKGLVAPDELKKAGRTPLAQMMPQAKQALATAVKSTPLRQTRQAAQTAGTPQQGQEAPQQQGQVSPQTFKAYINQMDKLLAQMKQAVPA